MRKKETGLLLPSDTAPGLTAEQKQLRMGGIGGSEIAAVAGLSPWQGPLDVYLQKTGQMEIEDNENMERGRYLEDGLRRWFVKRTGLAVRKAETLVHDRYPFLMATPDGIVLDQDGREESVLELKAPQGTADHWGEEGTADIPAYYIPQVMQEMAVAKLPMARVGAMLWGRLHLYVVHFDIELFEGLAELAEDFWNNNVLKKIPPSPDGSSLAKEWLTKRYPEAKGKDLVLATEQVDKAALELMGVQAELKELESRESGLKARLMEAIGEHQGTVGTWGKVLWGNAKGKRSTDWEALAKHLGATSTDMEKFTKEGNPYRVFRPYWKGGGKP